MVGRDRRMVADLFAANAVLFFRTDVFVGLAKQRVERLAEAAAVNGSGADQESALQHAEWFVPNNWNGEAIELFVNALAQNRPDRVFAPVYHFALETHPELVAFIIFFLSLNSLSAAPSQAFYFGAFTKKILYDLDKIILIFFLIFEFSLEISGLQLKLNVWHSFHDHKEKLKKSKGFIKFFDFLSKRKLVFKTKIKKASKCKNIKNLEN
ncbi:hypothetical protein BpHYR1_019775 [Brachionus plicatilis]|uniref:Uncharacterized protein n=1 Tax=Brachionus plicatilis TaxID=10195 RepID=A0A3M7PH90_BRAPC|nr:hypothetical protein BpHYR1_019775 [Brachionus plicatilis]